MPPVDKSPGSRANAPAVVVLPSPREAAQRALVYRRRRREQPRERLLRVGAIAGALLVHLVFLFGAVLGSAYELEQPPERPAEALQVRLIDKPEPPPPPPVRGTPPKRVGPTHRGSVASAPRRAVARAAASVGAELAPVPTPDKPVIAPTLQPATIKVAAVAAPPPPVSLPKPKPTPEMAPIPLAGEPPQIVLETPPAAKPVPPRFQPEPARKPQLEGTRPLPTPPSLAMPAVPAQAVPAIAPPSIALDTTPPVSAAPPSATPLARPEPPTVPAPAQMEAIPLPAQPAPQVDLQPQPSVPAPSVPRVQPQVQAPVIQVAEPQLAAVPLAPRDEAPRQAAPQAPSFDTSAIKAPAPSRPELARPQLSEAARPSAAAAEPSASEAAEAAATPDESNAAQPRDSGRADDVSRAPDATPQGSDTATPGQAEGSVASTEAANGKPSQTAPGKGKDRGAQGEGRQGTPQPGAARGETQGRLGSYVQLKPRGDAEIMEHRAPNIGYKPTRFEGDWTPEGESTIDTALRRAVEKTTVSHTFHLPRGVRLKCKVTPLFPLALLGCGNGDPPPKPVDDKVYERMYMAPANPLAPPAPAATASAPAPAAPIRLDNSAECAAARVSGGPLPPGCEAPPGAAPVPARPARAPSPSSSSWVPASDQFH
ncbi:hypothetical protein ASG87_01140 [Frateuria sp. Soil773]|nr:hypothetical protein ASG87_01140 [Frateuria sp. Soil773]